MKKYLRAIICSFAAVSFTASNASSETVLSLNSWLPPSHPYVIDFIKPVMADIEAVTAGRVTVEFLPAPLAHPSDTFELVRNGIVDISYAVQGYSPRRFKTAVLAEMPFLSDDAVISSVAFQRVHASMLADAGEYDGVKVMAVHTHGPGHIFSSRDIASVDDLEGQKLRTGSIVAQDLAKSFGAVPVEGPASKSYELLSQRVVDGIMFPSESVEFFRLLTHLSTAFLAEGGMYNTAFMVIMNEKTWNQISQEDRALIEPLLGEALAARAGKMWNTVDAAANETLGASIHMYRASADDVAALRERFRPVVDANIALASEAGVDGRAAYNMLLDEIQKLTTQ
ncbi:TRAP transporter substrate-binding protein [Palleronia caenipelagi]|uniref:TRAP transporter substrate-binding protein n=1 Tax=Palleronia caenipelagi TaxID=2489174 RepID=A0A547PKE7_9RHOB|nr:TRAP transporter substrate-binding protein [Palleronia caenipelagi]TRD14583.1 TRAP transporter substrate-binding protein [Palleronia caenipelagi]